MIYAFNDPRQEWGGAKPEDADTLSPLTERVGDEIGSAGTMDMVSGSTTEDGVTEISELIPAKSPTRSSLTPESLRLHA